jgi:N-acetylglucosaminyl-diphospho-decaprenol L-rhamnosyltransferase
MLSVVIPTFNTASMTRRCVECVLATSPEGTEVIVVDDGSRDGTAEMFARDCPDVQVVRLEINRGFSIAANHGVDAARGDIILLLNSDAVPHQGALGALLHAFENDPSLGVAGARLLNEDGSPQWSGGRTPALAWMIGVVSGLGPLASILRRKRRTTPSEVDWVSGAAMAFRREVWRDAGPLSTRYRFYCQDLEFCMRARDSGWSIRLVDDARVTHLLGATVDDGNDLRHDPAALWLDLLTWGTDRYGPRWRRIAKPSLASVATVRVAIRRLTLRGGATTAALASAAKALRQSDS